MQHNAQPAPELITNLKAVKITNWKELVPGGHVLHSGWAVLDVESNRLFAGHTGRYPYLNQKAVAQQVAQGGLIAGFATVALAGAA
ncbi:MULTISPECIES: hypothetical protein [Ectopseudomonas]|jgi:hypothetical protein|uniref:Uncharacterized protein n=2 Tax=Ectopseudomonas TaxID=3236654 RepID=A0A1G6PTN1_9GAMM|nr:MULTISPECIES: hypothetical protein [Pseudomonas]ALN21942.1 hypothetical protein DW68_025015 [Pseudomonas mendocina S5.2]KER98005.1 hypothetical protein HN51_24680 [Pseudomonas mendocina]MBP3061901.1 hypothetical protein [Pseudomonas chengduensis]NNB75193.1 hypothetical protein [Pseudomonas chengduensis]OEO24567.1 hypothetical protein AX279_18045 [Pseudomonas sp. J237]